MKGSFVRVFLICVLAVSVARANMFEKFKEIIDPAKGEVVIKNNLDSLSSDVSAIISLTAFHQSATLAGIVPGVDIGVHAAFKKTSKENEVFKAAGVNTIALPVAQAEVGIPFINTDLIARFTAYHNSSLIGGGIRFGFFENLLLDVSALGMINRLSVADKLKANIKTLSVGVNFNIPIISPYLNASFDSAEIIPDAAITHLRGVSSTPRIDAGINLSLIPLTYLNIGASYLINSSEGAFRTGLGVKF